MAQKFTVPVTIKNLSSAGSDGITVFLDQESFARLKVEAGGRITWGDGSGAGDTNLYRDAASVLKTDDTFKSAGLYVAGTQIDPTGAVIGDALIFNGTKFVSASVAAGGGGNASLTVSDTPPGGATEGDLWFESDTGKTFVYYDSFWVEVGSGGAVTAADSISGLSDVAFSTLSNGDFFRYNSSASVWTNDAINLSTDTIGDYVQSLTAGTGVTISNNSGEATTPTIAIGQSVGTSSSVQFAAVTAPLIGNASTASALANARTISLTGDVSGSTSFDGSSNVNIFTTVNTASVAIGELGGVVITNPEEFQGLSYNGTNWVNGHIPLASYVRNVEATTLTTGTAVYLFGGTGDHASVKRADNTAEATSSKTVGLVGAPIAASQNGPVITRGYVDGLDLSAYQAGDALWLGTNGQITTTKPTAPTHLVYIGVVVRATNNGIVYVAVQNGYELNELHDVKTNGKLDKDVLMWNSASAVWINDQINLGTDTVGNYMSGVSAGTGIAVSHTPGEGSTATISIESTAWTAYTPTITADAGGFALNNGTLTGRYKQVGKTVFFSLKFVFGSTTSPGTGHWNFSLPVTAYDSNFTFSAAILDDTVAWYGGIGNGNYTGSTSSFAVIIPGTNASVTTWAVVGNGGPFIWTTNDNITISGSYEAA